jgi:HEAT repeat protein
LTDQQKVQVAKLVQKIKDHWSDTSRREAAQAELSKMGSVVVPSLIELLREDKQLSDTPGWIAEVLGQIGDRRAVPPLIAFMESNAWYCARAKAAEVLGRMGDRRAVEPLIRQVGQPADGGNYYVCQYAAESLGKLGDSRAVAPLMDVVRKNSYSRARKAAAKALGDLHAVDAVGVLVQEIRTRKGDRDWLERSAKYGDNPIPEDVQAEIDRDCSLDQEDQYSRAAARQALIEIGRPATTALIGALEEKGLAVRYDLLAALTQIPGKDVSGELIAALRSPRPLVRAGAASALATRNEISAVDPLARLLDDPAQNVRTQAALALGHLRDKRSLSPLREVLKSRDSDLRWGAASALGELGDPRAAPWLVEAMKVPDPPNYFGGGDVSARAIGKLGDRSVVPALIAHLKDAKLPNRRCAAEALGLLKDRAAVDALIAALNDKNDGVKCASAHALGQIGDSDAVLPLIRMLILTNDNDPFYGIRKAAVESLSQIGDRRALKPLEALLPKPSPSNERMMTFRNVNYSEMEFYSALRESIEKLKASVPATQRATDK